MVRPRRRDKSAKKRQAPFAGERLSRFVRLRAEPASALFRFKTA